MQISISKLNEEICRNAGDFINRTDDDYYNRIRLIADDICSHRRERPIILLSGPSGSGKTTTAFILEKMLDERGFTTHTVSLDNYFLPLSASQSELAKSGELDLESPTRMDTVLLNSQIDDMIECKSVKVPKYDFKNATRIENGYTLHRKKDELVVFEGIHALNPQVVTVPDSGTAKVYISVRTRICDGEIVLHPSKIRLMRRMLRDKLNRGRSAVQTLELFDSVERGEDRYIMPYKNRSTYDVDTFIAYELSAYRKYLLTELEQINDGRIEDLIEITKKAEPLDERLISERSLIKEFIP